MEGMRHPIALVIDNFEAVTNPECLDAVGVLALGLPAGSQLAIGSRDALPLPAARLRAQGGIVEVGIVDLAMDPHEAGPLLAKAGVELADAELAELVGKTEGWPVGLYLAALAVKAGGSPTTSRVPLTGEDRFVGDYLRSEFLDRVSPAEATFLTHTSILDRMCGPLCDTVLGAKASSDRLDRLESRNLLVVPLDRRREWYRYHHLFRELLRAELRRREPEMITALDLRAAAWFEANGLPETAIDHAQAAGDHDHVADLVLRVANPVWASGRSDTVVHWMEWFEANDLVERHPAIAVHGALMFALAGRPGGTERWAAAAETSSMSGVLADGNTMEGTVAYLRALLCRDGIEEMRRDAQIAWDGRSAASPYRATMLHAEGLAYLLEGDPDRADAIFAHAVDVATRAGVLPFVPVLLAERGLVAIELDDWMAAGTIAEQAMAMMQGGQFDEYWTSALVYAWAAPVPRATRRPGAGSRARRAGRSAAAPPQLRPPRRVGAGAGRDGARLHLTRRSGGCPSCPPPGQRHLPATARPGQPAASGRRTSGQGRDDPRRRPGGVVAHDRGAAAPAAALDPPVVPGDRERLYVSRHTVKSQAISIYRKLGVSSRSETIERMHEVGLLEQV